MSGGVLTVVFEAPQAHRTLETSIISALIAGIYLGEIWRALTATTANNDKRPTTDDQGSVVCWRECSALVGGAVALGVVGILLVTALTNVDRYFNQQMNNQSVWQDMLGPDREIGRLVAQYNETTRFMSARSKPIIRPVITSCQTRI